MSTNPRSLHRRLIGVSFGPRSMAEALEGLPRIGAAADIVELRLDFFEEPYDLETLLRARDCPVVVTLRPTDQGGKSAAPAAERIEILCRAAALGAEYVDVEWDAATPERIDRLHQAGAQVLVSRHDFARMPADFAARWWPEMVERGADVVKIVGMANDVRDCLEAFRAFKRADRPTVAIAMGEAGLPTRVLALREEQCFLTYATPGSGARVAPGQIPIEEMRTVYRAGQLGPHTAAIGVIGPRIDSTVVARLNAALRCTSQDAVAVPFVAATEVPAIIQAYRELPVAGWAICDADAQLRVGASLDALGSAARRHGKVNTVIAAADGQLVGEWAESLDEQCALWANRPRLV